MFTETGPINDIVLCRIHKRVAVLRLPVPIEGHNDAGIRMAMFTQRAAGRTNGLAQSEWANFPNKALIGTTTSER